MPDASDTTVLDQLYLEDSYFLGVSLSGSELRFHGLFALTVDSPWYHPPMDGEQHCYREGMIIALHPREIHTIGSADATILTDPNGSLDMGSLEVTVEGATVCVETEWFRMTFETSSLRVDLSSPSPRP